MNSCLCQPRRSGSVALADGWLPASVFSLSSTAKAAYPGLDLFRTPTVLMPRLPNPRLRAR
jgi:hypothetical protein